MENVNKKSLVYFDTADPDDKRCWSGIVHNLVEQLRRYYDVDVVMVPDGPLERIYGKAYQIFWRLLGKHNSSGFSTFYAKLKGWRINRQVRKSGKKYDVAFFRGSNLAAFARTDIPQRVYFTDACFHQMLDYYFHNTSQSNVNSGNEVQRRAMENCTRNVFASHWAMNDALDFYKIPADRCFVDYFGANVDTSDFKKQPHDSTLVNLLFVGVQWDRKGGDIAVQCVKYLNEADPNRTYVLHLVGCKPPYEINDEHIKLYGFLNRNIPEQAQQMISLREQADLFLLPTRAECAGIVFCESSAYGIPSVTFDTGGIGDYIINGENGYRLPMGSDGKDFGEKILEILADEGKLDYMKHRAVEIFEERLNWDAFGNRLHEIIG